MRLPLQIALLLGMFAEVVTAQNKKIDSLKTAIAVLKTCQAPCAADTARVRLMVRLSKQLLKVAEYDSAFTLIQKTRHLSEKINFKRGQSDAFNLLGELYRLKGSYDEALENYLLSLKIASANNDKRGMGICYNNMGLVYDSEGNFPEALNCYYHALRIRDELHDRAGKASTFNNMGNLYYQRSDYKNALEYFSKALEIFTEDHDDYGISAAHWNMANALMDQGKLDEALKNYDIAIGLKKKINDRKGIANLHNNLGNIYFYRKQYKEAIENYLLHIKLKVDIHDSSGLGSALSNIGRTYLAMGNLEDAQKYLSEGLVLSKREEEKGDIEAAYGSLSELYEKKKDFTNALKAYKTYIAYRDSLFNEENTKQAVQLEMNYEFEKKQNQLRLDQEKKDALAVADTKRRSVVLYAVSGFGILILIFALFAYRSFLQKKKANKEITMQKEIIEQKQKEILDSIYYARRIQRSLLPNEKYMVRSLQKWK